MKRAPGQAGITLEVEQDELQWKVVPVGKYTSTLADDRIPDAVERTVSAKA